MKLLFASDSFKGSLTSIQISELLTRAAEEIFDEVECISVPVADGGEGTVDALIEATGGERIFTSVHDPLGNVIEAGYGRIGDRRAVIEMAAASGLTLVPEGKRNPLYTSSYGTGELILDALNRGFDDIYIAIGGSATNDGGMGCARALGISFLDPDGNPLEGRGIDLEAARTIDLTGLDPRIHSANITVMCDVTNPLCGEKGATYTFGEQKGATRQIMERLEEGMCNYRDVIRSQLNADPDQISGGGAAGGLGTALSVFLGGKMRSGIETVLDLADFDRRLESVDFIITGEGRTDLQSSFGKVMMGVGERGRAKSIPVIGLSGSLGPGAEQIYEHGISTMLTIIDSPMTLDEALKRAEELYFSAAKRLFRLIRISGRREMCDI